MFVYKLTYNQLDVNIAGSKGYNLALARTLELPIPYTLIVSSEVFDRFLRETDLEERVSNLYALCDENDELEIAKCAKEIQLLIEDTVLPDYMVEQLINDLSAFQYERTTIRASIVPDERAPINENELFHNINCVVGLEQVLSAIKNVWVSTFSVSALRRFKNANREYSSVKMAVLVQRCVPAANFYQLRSVDPISGDRDKMILTPHQHEFLPDNANKPEWAISKTKQAVYEISDDKQQIYKKQTRPNLKQHLTTAPLLSTQIPQIVNMAGISEQLLHSPARLDIAIMRTKKGKRGKLIPGKIYLLQVTPYNSVPPAPPVWQPPSESRLYWRGQLTDLMPGPMTPLFGSMGLRVYNAILTGIDPSEAQEEDPSAPYCLINNYLYRSIPFGATKLPSLIISLIRMLDAAFNDPLQTVRDAGDELKRLIRLEYDKPLSSMDPMRILELCQRLMYYTADHYQQIRYAGFFSAGFAQSFFLPIYKIMTSDEDPDGIGLLFGAGSTPRELSNSIEELAIKFKGTGISEVLLKMPLDTLEKRIEDPKPPIPLDPDEWTRLRDDLRSISEEYGHLCFDIDFGRQPLLGTQIALVVMLRSALLRINDGNNVRRVSERLRNRMYASFEKGWTSLFLPVTRSLHNWAWKATLAKEVSLSDLSYATPMLRKAFLSIGQKLVDAELLDKPNDVFWLYEVELEDLLRSPDSWDYIQPLGDIIALRRSDHETKSALIPPRYIGERVWFHGAFKTYPQFSEGSKLNGEPVTGGSYTGQARVLTSSDDIKKIIKGDILVLANLAPAWITVYGMAGAIISDVGGVYGHTSDLAREVGVPCVFNVSDASKIISDGMLLTVDGDKGSITIQIDQQKI